MPFNGSTLLIYAAQRKSGTITIISFRKQVSGLRTDLNIMIRWKKVTPPLSGDIILLSYLPGSLQLGIGSFLQLHHPIFLWLLMGLLLSDVLYAHL